MDWKLIYVESELQLDIQQYFNYLHMLILIYMYSIKLIFNKFNLINQFSTLLELWILSHFNSIHLFIKLRQKSIARFVVIANGQFKKEENLST